MTPFEFILYALAVFRMSLLVAKEDGPAWIFRKLRRSTPAKSSLKQGIQCVFCTSLWFAIPAALFIAAKNLWIPKDHWFIIAGDYFVIMLALSAGAIIINQSFTKGTP